MKKYKKIISLILLMIFSCLLLSCGTKDNHECVSGDWEFIGDIICDDYNIQVKKCIICNEILEEQEIKVKHDYVEEVIDATCEVDGKYVYTCSRCNHQYEITKKSTGHEIGEYKVDVKGEVDGIGTWVRKCNHCDKVFDEVQYVNNGYLAHGKLRVNKNNLVDKNGKKFQLFGHSTHGLQWAGDFVNYDTLAKIVSTEGCNVIRFALYTSEGGYCTSSEARKQELLETLIRGVDICTSLGIYAIIDWHMVGATDVNDKNPLYYLDESKAFFSYISEYYKDNVNVLYEIMNEPCGDTTWADCKEYANEVIPCIRKNTDAIILVGNPHWTADLESVMKSPLMGYTNIMYTYHFYADSHKSTKQVEDAYDKGFPVFISEYGFMDSSGDGSLNLASGERWYKALNDRNISYVAWNISNTKGSASIFKHGSQDMLSMEDDNLKEWGIFLRNYYRQKSGLDNE